MSDNDKCQGGKKQHETEGIREDMVKRTFGKGPEGSKLAGCEVG